MNKIIEAKPLPDYRLRIKFSDGVEGTVDLSDMVGKGIFSRWENKEYFGSVFVDKTTHTVSWPDGLDLCPDSLYSEITKKDISSLFVTDDLHVKTT